MAAPVSAQEAMGPDEEAHMRFDLGRRYYDGGRFADAVQEFERAYALVPLPDLLYNLYVAYRDGGDDVHAADALRRYIPSIHGDDARRALLEARLRTLDERLAAGTSAPPVAEEEHATLPPPEGSAELAQPTTSSPSVAPWIVGGVGVAMILASVGTGVAAMGEADGLAAACPGGACAPGFESARDRGQSLAIATDVLWIAGAVTTGAALIWLVVDATSSHTEQPPVAAACTDTGCVALAQGSF